MARVADPDLTERRKRQIMDAALACFSRKGFHQSSMQEICTEAQLSAGAIYRYFPSKTDIIAAIIHADGEDRQAMFDGITSGEEFVERLVVCAEAFVSKIVDRGGAPLMGDIVAEAMRNPELAAVLRHGAAPFRARLMEKIAACQARGEFDRSLDPAQAARIIFGGVDGLCMRVVMCGERERGQVGADVRVLLRRVLMPVAHRRPGAEKPVGRKKTSSELRSEIAG
ncbi:MAG: TetR/AcrR family transcriptional regulator [Pseudomonadota bacterium]